MDLYSATVPQFLQVVGSMGGLLAKAEAFCAERGRAPETLIQARLAEDMLPFAWQVKWVGTHSVDAIAGARKGLFSPDRTPPPESFAGLREGLDATRLALEALRPEEVDAVAEQDVDFVFGERRIPFKGQGFLMSFSMPNFYFHATTAYAILRAQGVGVGKTDYLGRPLTRD